MMQVRSLVFLLLILCTFHGQAYAAEDIISRIKAAPETPWVGQKVLIQLDVLAKDGWAQVKSFREPEVKGGFLHRYETQGTRLNEKIDGSDYSGQRYEVLLFGFRPGELVVPSIQLDVEVQRWGQQQSGRLSHLQTSALTLQLKMPEGAGDADGLISSESFRATQQWEPAAEKFKVGDAVIRTITRQAVDVSAMVFTPLEYPGQKGVGLYPSEPEVNDSFNRGELSGKRVEKITHILEQGGNSMLPELTFYWWNIKSEQLEKIVLPGRQLEVEGGALSSEAAAGGAEKHKLWPYLAAVVLAVMILLVIILARKDIFSSTSRSRPHRQPSEKAAFTAIGKAVKADDANRVTNATMRWLDMLPGVESPARLDLFLLRYRNGDSSYSPVLPSVNESGSLSRFYGELSLARKRYLQEQKRKHKAEKILPKVGLQEELGKEL